MQRIYTLLSRHSLLVSLVVLTVLFLAFFPTRTVSIDEQDYWQNAQLLVSGQLRQECDQATGSQYKVTDYCISKYNIGTSLLLIPAAILDSQALALGITFLCFILGIFIFSRLLLLLSLDPIFTYLYAFYPAFLYYSRTLFSETFSATLITFVIFALLKAQSAKQARRWLVAAGVGVGMAVLVRYTNVLPLGVLGIVFMWEMGRACLPDRQVVVGGRWSFVLQQSSAIFRVAIDSIIPIITGGLPFLILFLYLNLYLYQHPLRSGYYYSGEEAVYILSQVPLFLLRYVIVFTLSYPLMLPLAVWARFKYKWMLLLPVLSSMLFYAGFPSTFFEGRLLDLIFGIRFLVPVVPLILLLYAQALNQYSQTKFFRTVAVIVFLILGAQAAALNILHFEFLLLT